MYKFDMTNLVLKSKFSNANVPIFDALGALDKWLCFGSTDPV